MSLLRSFAIFIRPNYKDASPTGFQKTIRHLRATFIKKFI
jgi:hypothetical protein